jgi:N-acetylmuramoyl-L-alanine amidase
VRVDWSRMRIQTVVIDPGHGGKDPGTQGATGIKEKNLVLTISNLIKAHLEAAGLKVVLTRDSDEFVSLPQRTEIATRSDADLFVSIHANSNPARKTEGMEVYFCKTSSKRDLDEEQREKNERTFIKKLNSRYSPILEDVVADMLYVQKVSQSETLARKIVNETTKESGGINRGARPCRFFVVRNTLIPAVLVEVGFLSNRYEERKLSSPAYRQKLALAIANSIIKYATDS